MFSRRVEIGRVVYIPTTKSLGVIVNVVDHSRYLIDGPKIERQVITSKNCLLTDIKMDVPMNAGVNVVVAKWTKQGVDASWAKTAWAGKLKKRETRANTTDFDRFKRMVLRKQARRVVGKQFAKLRKAQK
jgi:large subunit ribosomal protein L14e